MSKKRQELIGGGGLMVILNLCEALNGLVLQVHCPPHVAFVENRACAEFTLTYQGYLIANLSKGSI